MFRLHDLARYPVGAPPLCIKIFESHVVAYGKPVGISPEKLLGISSLGVSGRHIVIDIAGREFPVTIQHDAAEIILKAEIIPSGYGKGRNENTGHVTFHNRPNTA